MGRTLLRGKNIRATRVDGCGSPVLGPESMAVAKGGFVTITLTPNNDTGTAIQLPDANGDMCVNEQPVPKFLNYGVDLAFCGMEPEFYELMTPQEAERDFDGVPVGISVDSDVDVDAAAFGLEFWTGIAGDVCEPGVAQEWGWGLLPFLKGGALGPMTVQNGAADFTITGAQTKDGTQWGVGPYDVLPDEDGNPGPIPIALSRTKHLILRPTSVPPPAATDGFGALGVPATGATAGTPGTWTPPNSYAPLNLAELTAGAGGDHGVAVVASPATAWTAGQSVVLRDGSRAHWTSAAWAAGPA